MSSKPVICGFCEQQLDIEEDQAGKTITCPACGKQFATPEWSEAGEATEPRKLSIRSEIGAAALSKACPSCGASMPEGGVLCMACGFDQKTGRKRNRTVSALPRFWWTLPAACLLLVAVLLVLGFILKGHDASAPAPGAPPAPAAVPLPSSEPDPAAEPRAADPGPAVSPAPTPSRPREDPAREEARRALEERYRRQVESALATEQPPWAEGDLVAVRQTSGMILRGRFAGLSEDRVVLEMESGTVEIERSLLDRDTRLRCDPSFRERFVEFQVRRRLQSEGDLQRF